MKDEEEGGDGECVRGELGFLRQRVMVGGGIVSNVGKSMSCKYSTLLANAAFSTLIFNFFKKNSKLGGPSLLNQL